MTILLSYFKISRLALLVIAAVVLAFYAIPIIAAGVQNIYTAGSTYSLLTAGNTYSEFTVGEDNTPAPAAPSSRLSEFTAADVVVTAAPVLLLMGLFVVLGFFSWGAHKEGNNMEALILLLIAFMLLGVGLSIGGPLMISALDYMRWGGW